MTLSFVRLIVVILLGSMMVWSCSNESGSGNAESLDLAQKDNDVVVELIASGANIAGANELGLAPTATFMLRPCWDQISLCSIRNLAK